MAALTRTIRRLIQTTRGRVLLLLSVLAVVWVGSAAFGHFVLGEFHNFGEALWSGVSHLLDPSSLRDDEGFDHRATGLFQVIFGLIFLVGLAFTVIAEVIGNTLERLGRYDLPVRVSDHLLLVGGLDLMSGYLSRLAQAHEHRRHLTGDLIRDVVVLAPEDYRDSRRQYESELRQVAGSLRMRLVIGDTSGPEGFELGAARSARAVVIAPGSPFGWSVETADLEVIQSGVALRGYLRSAPSPRSISVFMLFRRGRDVDAAWELFPDSWDALVTDRSLSAMLRLAVMRAQFAGALPIAGPAEAGGIYGVPAAGLLGVPFRELGRRFTGALPVGLLRGDGQAARLEVAPPDALGRGDRVVVLAPERAVADRLSADGGARPPTAAPGASAAGLRLSPVREPRRILIVGWNDLARTFLMELADGTTHVEVTTLSSVVQRHTALPLPELDGLSVRELDGLTTDPTALRGALAESEPEVIVVVAAALPGADVRTADAQAVVTVLQLRRLTAGTKTPLVAQLFAPWEAFALGVDPRIAVISVQDIIAGALALVVLEPLSASAAERLLSGEDARLEVVEYGSDDGGATTFGAVYDALLGERAAVLGVATDGEQATINPGRDWPVRPGDALLVARPAGTPSAPLRAAPDAPRA